MAIKALSSALILLTSVLSVRHAWGILRSSPEAKEMAKEWNLGRTGQLVLAVLILVSGVLILFPSTFVAGNLLGAVLILFVTGLQLRGRNLKAAAIEIPFFLLPLVMIYLGHPLRR